MCKQHALYYHYVLQERFRSAHKALIVPKKSIVFGQRWRIVKAVLVFVNLHLTVVMTQSLNVLLNVQKVMKNAQELIVLER